MSDSNTHLQRTVVRLPKSPNHHYYPYWHANWTPNYTCLHPPHVLEFFSQPLVFLELFMFLPPDLATIRYSYIYYYNHLPLLVYHYHFWLVSHHQCILLYLEVPQDLSSTPTRMVETNHFDLRTYRNRTETALVKVANDLLIASDSELISVPVVY